MTSEAPQRRFHLTLDLHADTMDDICHRLRTLANDGEVDGFSTEVTSGGYSDGYHWVLTDAGPEVTHDSYSRALTAYLEAKHADAP